MAEEPPRVARLTNVRTRVTYRPGMEGAPWMRDFPFSNWNGPKNKDTSRSPQSELGFEPTSAPPYVASPSPRCFRLREGASCATWAPATSGFTRGAGAGASAGSGAAPLLSWDRKCSRPGSARGPRQTHNPPTAFSGKNERRCHQMLKAIPETIRVWDACPETRRFRLWMKRDGGGRVQISSWSQAEPFPSE